MLAALAAATTRQEACVLVDTNDMFDPESADVAGVDFERLLWVRCDSFPNNPPQRHPSASLRAGSDTEKKRIGLSSPLAPAVEQALRVTDLLLQSGGFGLVAIDLGGVPFRTARRIPLTSWFRFQRVVEHTPTVLLVITPAPCAQTCGTLLLKVRASGVGLRTAGERPSTCSVQHSGKTDLRHAQLLEGFFVEGEILHLRLARKPVRPVTAVFATKAVRAG